MTATQITVPPTSPVSADVSAYQWTLKENARAVDGALLLAGWEVLGNPLAPDEMYQATDANRRKFRDLGFAWKPATRQRVWFSHSVPTDLAGKCKEYEDVIGRNIALGVGQPLPLLRASLAVSLVPVRVRISQTAEVADLSRQLLDAMIKQCYLPPDCQMPDNVRADLGRINAVHVYDVQGPLGRRVHAVIAFVSPPVFAANAPAAIAPVGAAHIDAVKSIYKAWAKSAGHKTVPLVYYSIGAASVVPGLEPTAAADAVWVFNTLCDCGEWKMATPLQLTEKVAVRDFLDRLKPETSDQRAARIADLIDIRCKEMKGSITLEWLAEKTQYRRAAVRTAMDDLQGLGHHVVYRRDIDGLLSIDRIEPGKSVRRSVPRINQRGRYYHLRQILVTGGATGLGLAVGLLRERFFHGILLASLFSWITALIHRYWSEVVSHEG